MPVPPDPKQWQQVESLFQQALEQPPEEVSSWLDRSCAGDGQLRSEVASLLESDEAAHAGFIGAWVQQAVIQHEESAPAMEGRRIGPYRLIREIGSGGMGAVYLADRDDQQYESRVAVKLVRPGFDTDFILRRFRRERQILARLEHPNITRLLDGGTNEDGTPWLVMEYIDGDWITRYAAAQGLEIDDRIRLFQPVCAAVQFAHRQFVVHRDLKPGNILVDRARRPEAARFRNFETAPLGSRCHQYAGNWHDDASLCKPGTDSWEPVHRLLRRLFTWRGLVRTPDRRASASYREVHASSA